MISVIVPVYNGEKYIETLIGCFQNQDFDDFEIIFVDDGSKDNSLIKLNKYKEESNLDIKIVKQKVNKGVSAARNKGIENAGGEYICFCDIDDEVKYNYLSEMFRTVERSSADLVICKHINIRNNESKEIKGSRNTVTKDSHSALNDFLSGKLITGSCTILVRKFVIDDNNLRFAEGYKYSEDLHMVWRLLACADKIVYLDDYLYLYKTQDSSATSKFDEERLHGYELMKQLESFFEKHNPDFAETFKKYGAARIMWSITWQAAILYSKSDFKNFIKNHHVRKKMLKLKTFNSKKVSLSAICFCLSPYLFRKLAARYGKDLVH